MSGTTRTLGTTETIKEFFHRFSTGDRTAIVDLFADEVDWNVAGADSVPWTGRRSTKPEIDAFLSTVYQEVETKDFAVDYIIAEGEHGVALGSFMHVVRRTGKSFSCGFALHVTVTNGHIHGYHMFEDSYAVAEAFIS